MSTLWVCSPESNTVSLGSLSSIPLVGWVLHLHYTSSTRCAWSWCCLPCSRTGLQWHSWSTILNTCCTPPWYSACTEISLALQAEQFLQSWSGYGALQRPCKRWEVMGGHRLGDGEELVADALTAIKSQQGLRLLCRSLSIPSAAGHHAELPWPHARWQWALQGKAVMSCTVVSLPMLPLIQTRWWITPTKRKKCDHSSIFLMLIFLSICWGVPLLPPLSNDGGTLRKSV